jgi:hypothetical protein
MGIFNDEMNANPLSRLFLSSILSTSGYRCRNAGKEFFLSLFPHSYSMPLSYVSKGTTRGADPLLIETSFRDVVHAPAPPLSLFPHNGVMKYFNTLVARAANPPNSRRTVLCRSHTMVRHDGQSPPHRGHLLNTLPILPGHDHVYACSIGNVFSVSVCQGQDHFLRLLEHI